MKGSNEKPPGWLLGAAVVAGWVAHDVIKLLYGRSPAGGLALLLPELAAIALGGLLGALFSRRRWIAPLALAVALLAAVGEQLLVSDHVARAVWLPRVVALLVLAWLLAAWAARRGLGALRAGLGLGLLACLLVCWQRELWGPASRHALYAALGALAAGALPRPVPRRLVTAALVAWPLVTGVSHALGRLHPQRPDLPPLGAAAEPGAPDLILIVLDTVRADRLAPYGHGRVTTPRLDAFVRERCVLYTDARSAGNYTLPSHASLFTGLFPAEHGAGKPRAPVLDGRETVARLHIEPAHGLRPDVPTLAEVLRARGYRTAGVVANNAYLHHAYGLDRGFEHWDDRDAALLRDYYTLVQYAGFGLRSAHIPYRDGDAITASALRWIRGLDPGRPFFLMLNYMDAHGPYHPTRRHRSAFSPEQPRDPLDPPTELWPLLYDRCLLDLDRHVGALFDGLEAQGVLERAVVIVTSDHGEAFGEHGSYNHGQTLYEELVHVPLFVKPAGPRERERDPTPISGVELPALALELLGLGPWPGARDPAAERGTLVSEWYQGQGGEDSEVWPGREPPPGRDLLAWLEGDRKWIVGSDGQVEVFDLARDPGEQSPLALTPEQVARALRRAADWWAANPPLEADPEAPALDAEHLERLRGLGYLGEED